MTDRRDKLQGVEELIKPEEEKPILVAAEYLRQRNPTKGFEELRQLARQTGWEVEVFPTELRERNVARFLAGERKIQIWTEGHSWDRLLYELAHELAYGNLAMRTKSQLTREAGIKAGKAALIPIAEREQELSDLTEDGELLEELGDKKIKLFQLKEGRNIADKAAAILYDHK